MARERGKCCTKEYTSFKMSFVFSFILNSSLQSTKSFKTESDKFTNLKSEILNIYEQNSNRFCTSRIKAIYTRKKANFSRLQQAPIRRTGSFLRFSLPSLGNWTSKCAIFSCQIMSQLPRNVRSIYETCVAMAIHDSFLFTGIPNLEKRGENIKTTAWMREEIVITKTQRGKDICQFSVPDLSIRRHAILFQLKPEDCFVFVFKIRYISISFQNYWAYFKVFIFVNFLVSVKIVRNYIPWLWLEKQYICRGEKSAILANSMIIYVGKHTEILVSHMLRSSWFCLMSNNICPSEKLVRKGNHDILDVGGLVKGESHFGSKSTFSKSPIYLAGTILENETHTDKLVWCRPLALGKTLSGTNAHGINIYSSKTIKNKIFSSFYIFKNVQELKQNIMCYSLRRCNQDGPLKLVYWPAAYWQAEKVGLWRTGYDDSPVMLSECCFAFNRSEAMLLEHGSR